MSVTLHCMPRKSIWLVRKATGGGDCIMCSMACRVCCMEALSSTMAVFVCMAKYTWRHSFTYACQWWGDVLIQ